MNWEKIKTAFNNNVTGGLSPKQKIYLKKYSDYVNRRDANILKWRNEERIHELFKYESNEKQYWGKILTSTIYHTNTRGDSKLYVVLCNDLNEPYKVIIETTSKNNWFGRKRFETYKDTVYLLVNKDSVKYYINGDRNFALIEKNGKVYKLTIDINHHKKNALSVIEQRLYVSREIYPVFNHNTDNPIMLTMKPLLFDCYAETIDMIQYSNYVTKMEVKENDKSNDNKVS